MVQKALLVTALVLGLVAPVLTAAPDPSLMGWWKFDGTWLDSSGNNRTGVPSGNAQFGAGMDGQGLLLDGSGDYVTITGYKGILGGNPFSIALWARSTSTGDITMVNWGSSTNGQRVDFRLYQGRLRVEHGNGNLQANTALNNGEWHYVALTVAQGTGLSAPGVQLYLDGKNDTQTTADPDTFNINAVTDVTIGRRGSNADRAFLGSLDEVRIYDRVLTADEIKALGAHPKAFGPSPADGAQDVGTPLLSWQPRETALWHDVYLGTDPNLGPEDLVAPHAMVAMYWHLPGLVPGTTYYWRVDEIDPDGTVHTGDVWSFFFMPKEAWKPNPTDGEPFADPNAVLRWNVGLAAISHDVYFGTDQAKVTDGAADVFKGNQMTTTFKTGLLALSTRYYWRIDEVAPDGTKVKGPVWTFKTLPEIALAADPNLVAWWTLDEGSGTRIVDWSGHGRHGQFNAAGSPTWAAGYDGTALSFDGPLSGDYVVTSYPGVTGIRSRSVTAWIKTATIGEIISWGQNVAGQKWIFRVQESNGTIGALRVEVNGGYQVGWNDLRDDEWHHVAAVLNGDGTPDALEIALYVDGLLEPSSASLDEPINTIDTGVVRIGESPWHNRPFTGLIDDVRMFDKALTQAEIELVMRVDPLRAWMPQPANGAIADIRTAAPLTWTKGDPTRPASIVAGSARPASRPPRTSSGVRSTSGASMRSTPTAPLPSARSGPSRWPTTSSLMISKATPMWTASGSTRPGPMAGPTAPARSWATSSLPLRSGRSSTAVRRRCRWTTTTSRRPGTPRPRSNSPRCRTGRTATPTRWWSTSAAHRPTCWNPRAPSRSVPPARTSGTRPTSAASSSSV
ncbi:MAG: hypothetical protein MUC88_24550 [Planctomycetes bacterium]|nr:hypothetical protein [Planctomycetota bacterium]